MPQSENETKITKHRINYNPFQLAGLSALSTSVISVLYNPLYIWKIALQTNPNVSCIKSLKNIYHLHGFTGLFTFNLKHNIFSSLVQEIWRFSSLIYVPHFLNRYISSDFQTKNPLTTSIVNGSAISIVNNTINVVNLVQVRSMTNEANSSPLEIYRKLPFRQYFKGSSPEFLKNFTSTTIFVVLDDMLRNNYLNGIDTKSNEYYSRLFTGNIITSLVITLATTPLDFLRTKTQLDYNANKNLKAVATESIQKFGLSGAFRSFFPRSIGSLLSVTTASNLRNWVTRIDEETHDKSRLR